MFLSIEFDLRCAACGEVRTRSWSTPRQPTATYCLCGRPMSVLAVQVQRPEAEYAAESRRLRDSAALRHA